MKVRSLKDDLVVDGKSQKKGAEFDMANTRAAYDAAEAGLVKIVEKDADEVLSTKKTK